MTLGVLLQEARTWDEVAAKKKSGKMVELDFSAKAADGSTVRDSQQIVDAGQSLVDVDDDVSSSEDEAEVIRGCCCPEHVLWLPFPGIQLGTQILRSTIKWASVN